MFFYEWVERCEPGKAWDLLCKNKMFFEKYTLLFDTSFFVGLFNFYFFLPSQTWLLAFSLDRLQKILCLVFLFVCCVPPFFFVSFLCAHLFFPKYFGFFPKSPILEFACWDSLESFFLLFCYRFDFFRLFLK